MYRGKSIAVVVPAYNEEKLIGATLESIPDYVDRVFVVNDGSTDGTADIVEEYKAKDPRIRLINKSNGGVGSAIVFGYKAATEEGLDISAVMAGDNQMDPAYLPSLLDPIIDGEAHYTKGNRLSGKDSYRGMSRWRLLGNNLLTLLTKISSGLWHISDPQNGYTAIDNSVFKRLDPEEIFAWYGYCNDLLTRLNMYGFVVKDVPIPARYGDEKSKIKYPEYIYRVSKLLLLDFVMRISYKQKSKSVISFVSAAFVVAVLSYLGILVILGAQSVYQAPSQVFLFLAFASALTVSILLVFYLFLMICGTALLHRRVPKLNP